MLCSLTESAEDKLIVHESHLVHHVSILSCSPGLRGVRDGQVWDCSVGPVASHAAAGLPRAPTCSPVTSRTFFHTANTSLPSSFAYRLHGSPNRLQERGVQARTTGLVLNVHFRDLPLGEKTLTTGEAAALLHFVPQDAVKRIAVLMSVQAETEGKTSLLPRHQVTNVDLICPINSQGILSLQHFNVHTHGLGREVSGWRVSPSNVWTRIGRVTGDTQSFRDYHVAQGEGKPFLVASGDRIAVRCTYNNTRMEDVRIGGSATDEMCAFYLMFHTTPDAMPDQVMCQSPANYSWALDPELANLPESL